MSANLKQEARKLMRQAVNLGGIVYLWTEAQELAYAEDQKDFDSWPGEEALEDGSVEIIYRNDA